MNVSLPNQCMKGLAEPRRVAAVEACHSLSPHSPVTDCGWIQQEDEYLWVTK